jgi:hypothetical protein
MRIPYVCDVFKHYQHYYKGQTMITPTQQAALFSSDCQQFLLDLTKIAGNGVYKPEDLEYYLTDLYTWFDPSDLLPKYTKQQIGGYLSYLQSIQVVDIWDLERNITEFGVLVAIANACNYFND